MDVRESRLLIQEDVMDDPPNPRMAAMDMIMLSLGGKQRGIDRWQQLAQQAGLRMVQVHRDLNGKSESLCVIECVKDDSSENGTGMGEGLSTTSSPSPRHSPSSSISCADSSKALPPNAAQSGMMLASALTLPVDASRLTPILGAMARQVQAWLWR